MKLLDSTFLAHHARGTEAVAEYLSVHEDEEWVTSTASRKSSHRSNLQKSRSTFVSEYVSRKDPLPVARDV